MASTDGNLRFGPFEVNPATGELRKNRTRIKLASQSFQVLMLLAERSGDLVSREEIRAALWPNETVVEWEHSINTAIQRIRAALNDSTAKPRYIETLPRRGYRFLAPVERVSASAIAPQLAPASERADDSDPLGQTLSHYRVSALLGRGGMGVVYRGEDILLGRMVALKFLRPDLASDPVSVERFQREARAASSLNHPNICTIYEVETFRGRTFLSMELLEGRTLRERITGATKGELLPCTTVVEIGIGVAEALDAAHLSGMIHRDITPANVFLTRNGGVKVLDFGLAKTVLREPLPTSPAETLTSSGAAPGTLAYMSPEQRRGEDLDGRTDLYSLGVVLREAAVGRTDFTAGAAIREHYPARFWEIIGRLVDPDASLRYQTAGDIASDLRRLRRDLSNTYPVEQPLPSSGRKLTKLSIAVVSVLIALLVIFLFGRGKPLGEMATQPLTGMSGLEDSPAFAPDGKMVAYSLQQEDESASHLYAKLIGGGPPIALTSGECIDTGPAWSPDGRMIAFLREQTNGQRELSVIPALGGSVRKVANLSPAAPDRGSRVVSWLPNSLDLLVSDRAAEAGPSAIYLLSLSTGARRKLTSPAADASGDGSPEVSPDGKSFAFIRWMRNSVSDIYVQPFGAGTPRRLTLDEMRIASEAWSADGRTIVFASPRGALPTLWQILSDGGKPQPLSGTGGDAATPSISRTGNLLAYVYQSESSNLWRVPGPASADTSSKPVNVSLSPREDISGEYSPNGQRIAFSSDRAGSFEIWVAASDGSSLQQLTFFKGPITGSPHWSPDGRSIVFDSRPMGKGEVFVIGSDGGQPRRITNDQFDNIVPSWSRNGKSIYYCANRGSGNQVYRVPAAGGDSVAVTRNGGFEAMESPDGLWLYFSKQSAQGVWRAPLAGGNEQPVLDRFVSRFWTISPWGLVYLDIGAKPRPLIDLMNLSTRHVKTLGQIGGKIAWGASGFSVSPDGKYLLYAQLDRLVSQIRLVENFR